ncbi:hypothetical protein [Aquabacter spiritensis]|uniref:hypothetical protein n=1 Tax=Aquabacter spiritensis TaxID=933073 RepID=UPI001FDF3E5D|nr:hypothetical protein [Aquabacter spiritensis]
MFRFFGFWILAGGFVALIVDGTRSIAAARLTFTSAADAWSAVSPDTFALARARLTDLSTWAWPDVAAPLLGLPLFVLLCGLGFLLLAIGRARRRSRYEVG